MLNDFSLIFFLVMQMDYLALLGMYVEINGTSVFSGGNVKGFLVPRANMPAFKSHHADCCAALFSACNQLICRVLFA